ncbi:hypothetical protein BCR39DRAFT_594225 [Naematelia encephala]|uniref:NAD-dependent epimerase/dehydratase domain-containing protein n=1 Tax=Naematelia encephala TaxID=71784 RepID=A0A1Y2B0E3_9TREE|nr:hypothetical protein BCR39DRAFT_594225 [Naematelia encephala]
MHILLTGAAGKVGSHVLKYFLNRGHSVTALDVVPLPVSLTSSVPESQAKLLRSQVIDLTDFKAYQAILESSPEGIDGVVHLGAIPDPLSHDPRIVHNNNVTSSYNVLQTSMAHGITRIVQASSVNAPGLSFGPEGHLRFDSLPIREEHPSRPEDPYALSKAICELQASALCRYTPGLRIASLRFHMCCPDYSTATTGSRWQDLWAWTSFDACASACLLALTSEGWEGHEAFNIVAPEICWEGGVSPESKEFGKLETTAVQLVEYSWKGKYDALDEEWWKDRPRRSLWDSSKAERLLGWDHDNSS